MSVRSVKNQYPGINPHLHSQWQHSGGWTEFHTNHIADLTRLMRAALFPLGYTAHTEQSLQIRRFGEGVRNPRADVLLVDDDQMRVRVPPRTHISGTDEVVATLPDALGILDEELDYHKAVVIYRNIESKGDPVAWVELLSPSNKPGGSDWWDYQHKRENLLYGGLIFVELDYLHESAPTIDIVANYQTRGPNRPSQPGSHPYRLMIFDPRPEFHEGQARVRQFDVDEPLPTIDIPLSGDDHFAFDFNAAYQKTFTEMLYGNEVDYRQLPVHFERYSEADQARILGRILAVLRATQAGVNLDTDLPLIVEAVTVEAGMEALKNFA